VLAKLSTLRSAERRSRQVDPLTRITAVLNCRNCIYSLRRFHWSFQLSQRFSCYSSQQSKKFRSWRAPSSQCFPLEFIFRSNDTEPALEMDPAVWWK